MIEKKEPAVEPNWLDGFSKDSSVKTQDLGYLPLPTNVQGEPEGSVYMAHLRQENTIGSLLNRHSMYQLDENTKKDYDFTNYINQIPRDLVDHADKFFGSTTQEEFKSIESQLRQEINDKSLLAAHPWKSLAYSLDPLEPTNYLPGSLIFKEAKAGAGIARSMMGASLSAIASTGIQEAVLHQNQLTRAMQESVFNVVGAGVLGGVIGGAVGAFGRQAGKSTPFNAEEFKRLQNIQEDVNNAITPNENLSAARSATLDDAGIARMPKFIAETMKFTPMNRLLNSPFNTAKWFGSTAFEHNYELVKNSDGKTSGISIERSIKMEMRLLSKKQIDHVNYFYDMHGIGADKKFKATRKTIGELGTESSLNMNLDQFNVAVYETALTGADHAIPQINSAATMWRKYFDDTRDQAISLGLLPEDVKVPNAPNYIMVMYNKNKIIEQGGKAARGEGTFPQHLYQQFEASNETTKQYLESPMYIDSNKKLNELKKLDLMFPDEQLENFVKKIAIAEKKIEALNRDIKRFNKSEKPDIKSINKFKKQIKDHESDKARINDSIESHKNEKIRIAKEIEAAEKAIIDNAPSGAKTWDGKLHNIIKGDDAEDTALMIWTQVEQTIDNILGDSDGKLLNPFMSKLGGESKPFKARKLIIDQLQASPWHITDIQQIASAHNRAMVPAIKLQAFAKQHGYADINAFLEGVGESIRKEFDAEAVGKTGKDAQKLRKQYDAAIRDMQATVGMLQGVYGQGFNVLNSKSAEFFNNVLNWNYTRMLGHMTLASLPELGLVVMRNGVMETLAHGIGEAFSKVKKISKNDLQSLGYAIETELGTQFKSYIEHDGLTTNPSPFTKGLDSLTKNFGNLSLMNQWTDMVQNLAGHMAINKILNVIHKAVDGKATQKELTNLARLGIAQEHFAEIAKFTKDNIYKGTRYADWTKWEIKTQPEEFALKSFQAAVSKSIDEIAIMPNFGDKPLTLQQKGAFGNLSKLMFQFKSYLMAATNRVLYSGIQNRYDINLYTGVISMMGLGMLGYLASSFFRGSEPDLSPTNLLQEGLDRSGVLGIYGEGINIGRKLFQIGDVSRYKSRDAFGSVLGPTGGSSSELVGLFNKLNPLSSAKGEWTTKDADIIMKLMPLQNLFYLQKINRTISHGAAESLGATPVND